MSGRKLTLNQQNFIQYLLADPDRNATAAYRKAYPNCKSDDAARSGAARTLAIANVQQALADADQARARRLQIEADAVLRHWWLLATADPNELIELRRTCCRYCHGIDHGYQRTTREMDRDRAAWRQRLDEEREADEASDPPPFDEAGGVGYDARRPPHPDCPECFGEGVGRAFPRDTRSLSPAARILYAGVKETKDGVEIKMRDQDAAMVNVARHLGMFPTKVEHTGRDGGPIQNEHVIRESVTDRINRLARAFEDHAAGEGRGSSNGNGKPVGS